VSLHHRFRQPRGSLPVPFSPLRANIRAVGLPASGPPNHPITWLRQYIRRPTHLGRDMAEHDARLRSVLDRLAKYGATLRVEKCVLGQPEVDFNGHRVSANGVRHLQSNVAALERIPPPTNQRQLSRFVGAATYYAKFVPLFAELCRPFRPLLKSNSEWAWSADCQPAFDTIKEKIASPPTLAHFDVSADETLVTCDASATALGACLSQKVGGVERPIAFASRVLSPAERKYSASEREALACLWACERWHFFLYGRRFTLITDHQALKTLLTTGDQVIAPYVYIGGATVSFNTRSTYNTAVGARTVWRTASCVLSTTPL
jgi:hypothetical protein